LLSEAGAAGFSSRLFAVSLAKAARMQAQYAFMWAEMRDLNSGLTLHFKATPLMDAGSGS
jgi:hypothetical protein